MRAFLSLAGHVTYVEEGKVDGIKGSKRNGLGLGWFDTDEWGGHERD